MVNGDKSLSGMHIFVYLVALPEGFSFLLLFAPGQYTIIDTHFYLLASIGRCNQTRGKPFCFVRSSVATVVECHRLRRDYRQVFSDSRSTRLKFCGGVIVLYASFELMSSGRAQKWLVSLAVRET